MASLRKRQLKDDGDEPVIQDLARRLKVLSVRPKPQLEEDDLSGLITEMRDFKANRFQPEPEKELLTMEQESGAAPTLNNLDFYGFGPRKAKKYVLLNMMGSKKGSSSLFSTPKPYEDFLSLQRTKR